MKLIYTKRNIKRKNKNITKEQNIKKEEQLEENKKEIVQKQKEKRLRNAFHYKISCTPWHRQLSCRG